MSDEPNLEESTRKESIEDGEFYVSDGVINQRGTLDILMQYPYNMSEWLGSIQSHLEETFDVEGLEDDTIIATAQVDKVSYVDPDTGEFDVRFEGRWELSEGAEVALAESEA